MEVKIRCFLLTVLLVLQSGRAISQSSEDVPPYLKYPKAPVREVLLPGIDGPVYLQIVNVPLEQVTQYFIRQGSKNNWVITFPNEIELQNWLQALKKTPNRSPIIQLYLTNIKTNVNLSLTIGHLFNASLAKSKTIITVYITKRPLGR